MNKREYKKLFNALEVACEYCVLNSCMEDSCPLLQTQSYYSNKYTKEHVTKHPLIKRE